MPHDANWRCGEFEWRKDGTCNFCGSITPEAMMEAVRAGKEIIPTDKAYKIYVDGMTQKFYMNHLTSSELSVEFWDLYQSGKMKLGFPGRFYTKIWLPGMPKGS